MVTAQVPKVWSDRGFVSMKPLGSWLKDLTARLSFLRSWIDQGPPKCFWMAGLFFPQVRKLAALYLVSKVSEMVSRRTLR